MCGALLSRSLHAAQFPPLTCLEVVGLAVEGSATVYKLRPSLSGATEQDALQSVSRSASAAALDVASSRRASSGDLSAPPRPPSSPMSPSKRATTKDAAVDAPSGADLPARVQHASPTKVTDPLDPGLLLDAIRLIDAVKGGFHSPAYEHAIANPLAGVSAARARAAEKTAAASEAPSPARVVSAAPAPSVKSRPAPEAEQQSEAPRRPAAASMPLEPMGHQAFVGVFDSACRPPGA